MTSLRDPARLAAVAALGLLGTPPEDRFDRITRTAAALFDVPVALVNLLDAERLFVKSAVGDVAPDHALEQTVCAVTVDQGRPLVVRDLTQDARFAGTDVVRGGMRFYAGVPLRVLGHAVGTLCLFDAVVRDLSDVDLARLTDLAGWAEDELGRIELESALSQQHETAARLSAVLDASPDAVLVLSEDGVVQESNAASAEVFGVPREAVLGQHVTELLRPPQDQDLEALLGHDVSLTCGLWARRPGGDAPVEVRARRLQLARPERVLDIRDVSGRAEVERELTALQQRFELILDAAGTGVVGTDQDGRITVVNPAAAAMLGLAGNAVGADLHDVAHGDLHPRTDCPLLRALSYRVPRKVPDGLLQRSDGTQLDVEESTAPIVVDDVLTGAVVTLVDTSARRAVDQMKDEFISVVSHELRTPLTSIRGSLGLLGSGRFGELPGAASRLVQIAVGNTDRLVRLVNDILDLERIESGKADVELLTQPLRPLLDIARDNVVAPGGPVEVVVGGDDLEAAVDADLFVQALTNLVANAVKFSPEGASVQVGCRRVGSEVHVEVRDQGRGIPADRLARIFERFEQVDASDAREKGGTGLGLAITRSVAKVLGGRVLVTSDLGHGSTFTLALPSTLAGDERSGRWVVLVEDDVDLSEVLTAGLGEQGFDVAVARTEEEAVALAVRLRPVLLLLDVELARGSGYGVAARLRGAPEVRHTVVIVATVHDLDEVARERLRLGDTWFVRKGRGDEDVVEIVLSVAREAVGR